MKLKTWISDNTTDGLVTDICSAFDTGYIAAFHEMGFDSVLDETIISRHGRQTIDEEYVEDPTDATDAVRAYLLERSRYLYQIVEYYNAEYNPIENYSQTEHETIKSEFDEVNQHGTDTKAQDTYRHGEHTDSDIFPACTDSVVNPQYTDTLTTGQGGYDITQHTAKVQTQTTPPGDTNTLKVAPFESDSFHNKEQTSTTHTQGTQTVERIASGTDAGNDKTSFSQKVDTNQHGAHTDQITKGAHTDQHTFAQYDDIAHVGGTQDSYSHISDEREDNVTRDLSRSGNIGVQTAAQMLQLDEAFWWNFKPLQKLAREIAALLAEGVEAI